MARGGYRPGAGRKPGSRDLRTVQLERAMLATNSDDFVDALIMVIEDPANPERLRLDACQCLSGRLMSRVLSLAHVQKQFPNFSEATP